MDAETGMKVAPWQYEDAQKGTAELNEDDDAVRVGNHSWMSAVISHRNDNQVVDAESLLKIRLHSSQMIQQLPSPQYLKKG